MEGKSFNNKAHSRQPGLLWPPSPLDSGESILGSRVNLNTAGI